MKVYEIQSEYDNLIAMNEAIIEAESTGLDVSEMKADIEKQLEQLGFETESKMENIAKLIRNLEAESTAYKAEIERMAKKMKSVDSQISYIKEFLIKPVLLKRDGKLNAGLFKLSLRKSKAVNIYNDSEIPSEYKETVTTVKILKAEISKALKENKTVSGCELIENKSVQIK